MEPIMKWAGGKRKLLNEIKSVICLDDFKNNRIYEPFVGGGAFFLDLEHNNVLINDINDELINVYIQIRNNPKKLIKILKEHKKNHSHDYYYKIRNYDRSDEINKMTRVEKAARTIYLNRVCYNGLYRVNSKGQFNVPLGRYVNPEIVFEEKIKEISQYLKKNNVEIVSKDFAEAVKSARKGDLVYFDPPYDYSDNGFTSYTKNGFSQKDLERLKEICDELIEKGCKIIVSNNDTVFVNNLFSDPKYKIIKVKAKRMINCKGEKRAAVEEVIIHG